VAGAVNRLHLVIGRGVPVGIQRELDVKIDDGVPNTGTLRATVNGTANDFTGTNNWGGSDVGVDCANVTVTPSQWNVAGNSSDCNSVFLF
jgi:phage-related protein